MVNLAGIQKLYMICWMRFTDYNKLRYGVMEPSVSENQTQDLPVGTRNTMCANEPVTVRNDTETGEPSVEGN